MSLSSISANILWKIKKLVPLKKLEKLWINIRIKRLKVAKNIKQNLYVINKEYNHN